MKALKGILIAVCFCVLCSAAVAQEMVHALSGTVLSVNPKIKMTEINTDNGTSGHFEWLRQAKLEIAFDKTVKADATDADKFTTKGTHVIVYYIGQGDVRTIIAVHDLGDAPLQNTSGTVVKFSKHDRLITIKNSAGTDQTFHLDPKTVADTSTGVVQDLKYDFSKGDLVMVTAGASNDGQTALLIAPKM